MNFRIEQFQNKLIIKIEKDYIVNLYSNYHIKLNESDNMYFN